jgi:hypothetical protein
MVGTAPRCVRRGEETTGRKSSTHGTHVCLRRPCQPIHLYPGPALRHVDRFRPPLQGGARMPYTDGARTP